MEFGLDHSCELVCDQVRAISTGQERGRRLVRSEILLRYPGRRQVRSWSQTC